MKGCHIMEKEKDLKKNKESSAGFHFRSDIALSGPISISNATAHLGNAIHIGTKKSAADSVLNSKRPDLTPEIKELFHCSSPVNSTHRVIVSRHIGKKWRHVGKELAGLSDGELDTLENDYKSQDLEEMNYQILLKWTSVKGSDATLGVLAKALWKHKVFDAVTHLIQYLKQSPTKEAPEDVKFS